jgi:isocitrate dehydrogenase kinase/phosphatase
MLGDGQVARQLPVSGAHQLVLSQQGCLHRGQADQWLSMKFPFALPILYTKGGPRWRAEHQAAIDAVLHGEDDCMMLFSFARAYFMVDMEIPRPMCSFCAA